MTGLKLTASTKTFYKVSPVAVGPHCTAGHAESKAEVQDLRADRFYLHPLYFFA